MNEPRNFSHNWRHLPADYVMINIKTLQNSYKNYPISFPMTNKIKLGDDIIIKQKVVKNKTIYVINGFSSPVTDKELKYLYNLCIKTATPTDKICHWCEHHVRNFVQIAGYTAAATVVIALGTGTYNGIKKQKQEKAEKLEEYVQQRIKEFEASKVIHYQDALNQKTR